MTYPSSVADIESRITALAASSPICTATTLPHQSVEGRDIEVLEIRNGVTDSNTPVVLVVGGIHAREWAPPDAVLSFAEKLVAAHSSGNDMEYPAFTDGPATYERARIPNAQINAFVDEALLLFLPLANPDGRERSRTRAQANDTSDTGSRWRGNRNIDPATGGCPNFGVDINRNFDWQWDPNPYYRATDAAFIENNLVQTSCMGEQFKGAASRRTAPGAVGEPETANIEFLVDSFRPMYYMDIHGYGRQISIPWGIALNQTNDPTKSFDNVAHDRMPAAAGSGRSAVDGTYKEYIPNTADHPLSNWQDVLALRMIDQIRAQAGSQSLARTRSTYTKIQTAAFYAADYGVTAAPLPANSDGFAFSRAFRQNDRMAFSCTLEIGSDGDGEMGFFPPESTPTIKKYEKIEREAHTAIWVMLDNLVNTGRPGNGTPL